MPTPPRRFRFGLRSLFVLVTLASIATAWVTYALNWNRQREAFLPGHGWLVFDFLPDGKTTVRRPPWSLYLVGATPVGTLYISPEEDTPELRALFPESTILLTPAKLAPTKS